MVEFKTKREADRLARQWTREGPHGWAAVPNIRRNGERSTRRPWSVEAVDVAPGYEPSGPVRIKGLNV